MGMVVAGAQRSAERPAGRSAAIAWLVHPATVAALVVLVLNDHLFKEWFPGLVTGKASDVAGLMVMPPVLAVLAGFAAPRLRGGRAALGAVVLTGLGFAAVKAVPTVPAAASRLLSLVIGPSVLRADPTDLVALPALGAALWIAASSDGPSPRMALRRLGAFVVLPAAVVALAATTAPYRPPRTEFVTTWQSSLISEQTGSSYYFDSLAHSEDGGRTWHVFTDQERSELPGDLQIGALAPALSACVPTAPTICYRITAGRSQVEQSTDGGASYQVVWALPAWQQRQLAWADGVDDVAVGPQSLTIQIQEGQGYLVVVACGLDGYLVGGTAIGGWQRIGFGTVVLTDGQRLDLPPPTLPALQIIMRPSDLPLSLLAGAIVCILAGLSTQREFTSTTRVLLALLPVAVICGMCGGVNDSVSAPLGPDFAGPTTWLAAVAALAIAANVFIAAFDGYGKWRVLLTIVSAPLGCAALLICGSTGLLDRDASRWLAIGWTLVTAALAAGLGAHSSRASAERAQRELVEPEPTPTTGIPDEA